MRVLTECDSSLASSVPTERILMHKEKKKKKKNETTKLARR